MILNWKWKKRFIAQLKVCIDLILDNRELQKKYRDLEIALVKSNELTERLLKIIENK
jgi:hypothetical protein